MLRHSRPERGRAREPDLVARVDQARATGTSGWRLPAVGRSVNSTRMAATPMLKSDGKLVEAID